VSSEERGAGALKEKPSPKANFATASTTPTEALIEELDLKSGNDVAINVATKGSTASQSQTGRQTQPVQVQQAGKPTDSDKGSQSESVAEGTPDAATLAAIEASQMKAQQALGSLLLTYPAILSIEYQ
jgi:hypothetical protein